MFGVWLPRGWGLACVVSQDSALPCVGVWIRRALCRVPVSVSNNNRLAGAGGCGYVTGHGSCVGSW